MEAQTEMPRHKQILDNLKQLKSLDAAARRVREKSAELHRQRNEYQEELGQLNRKMFRLKLDVTNEVELQSLNRRAGFPDDIPDFCSSVEGWIERANHIRRSTKVVYLDGRDLDVPDVDILRPEERVKQRCYACNVYKALNEIMSEMLPESRDVLRARYGIHKDERLCYAPGFIANQRYIAQQLGISPSTVSRRLQRAERAIRHPYRAEPLKQAIKEQGTNTVCCASVFLFARCIGTAPAGLSDIQEA